MYKLLSTSILPLHQRANLCSLVKSAFSTTKTTSETITYNEVKIKMLSRSLQKVLFGKEIKEYDPPSNEILQSLIKLGIDIDRPQKQLPPLSFKLPNLLGSTIDQHLKHIANQLTAPYIELLNSFDITAHELPTYWSFTPGWSKYVDGQPHSVDCPEEDVYIFDTEVLMSEGDSPTLAIAYSPSGWYSWVSPRLFVNESVHSGDELFVDSLIPFHTKSSPNRPKCIIGHFVSYDRARIREEYQLSANRTRFVDTLALHVAVSGLTSTQRYLKAAAKKQLFNNKIWQKYIQEHKEVPADPNKTDDYSQNMDLQWISETSLNNLTDVYKLYCGKDPPQSKELRSVFQDGSRKDVIDNFQTLMTYCATDVLMTHDVFVNLWPIFQERFPHPATLHGMLEMGSVYLPISNNWTLFQQRADGAFAQNELRQKKLLMQLAEQTLRRYLRSEIDPQNDPWLWDLDWSTPKLGKTKSATDDQLAKLPKWYRELIPKPIKSNLDVGPSLLTAQMRIAPKLLRLCWRGLPLHYDQSLKWGVLIPGRAVEPYGDPRFYDTQPLSSTAINNESLQQSTSTSYSLRPTIPVTKLSASGEQEMSFPYSSYLSYWSTEMQRRLASDLDVTSSESLHQNATDQSLSPFANAYTNRVPVVSKDDHLMHEFQRTVEAMPLSVEERRRLSSTIRSIREAGMTGSSTNNDRLTGCRANNGQTVDGPVHKHLGELQIRGQEFWSDAKRYQNGIVNSTAAATSNRASKKRSRSIDNRHCRAVHPVNPVIPTCWFNHLPHENGEGLPVGSPLAKSFQGHIAANRLHSADDSSLANQLLQDRIHASFWQSYSKRVKSQLAVQLPPSMLPEISITSTASTTHTPDWYGAILPQLITAGTVSRRAVEPLWLTASNADKARLGSELKAMIQSPPGYLLVGADVDSQEMWIAALIGDASLGFQGATPYGWMTLEGNRADGTDLHTKIAKLMGITRTEAKILNYARLYGSGYDFTKHILTKFSKLSPEQAGLKASQLIRTTKGQRVSANGRLRPGQSADGIKGQWQGGTESAVFNQLERIARSPDPRTPFLGARITRALNPKLVKDDFLPSRINWVVQSSAVDYMHCMLTFMSWLIAEFNLPARLCINIHDEVRYLCAKDTVPRLALALQISNLFTRAFFAHQLGMCDLPESVAFFSSVEVDQCLRKSPTDDCVTPSNPDGLEKGYSIPPGKSLTIEEILELTKGSLE